MSGPEERIECFGRIECVFPMGDTGLRESPETCMACELKVECLKTAIAGGGGLTVEEEKIDRAYASRRISFVQRWARRKAIHRRREVQKARNRKEGKET